MKGSNHALEEHQRRQQIERCDEARRAHEMGTPVKAQDARRKPSLFDKARLLYRLIQLIKKMKNSSWKTTLGGILIAAGQAVPALLPAEWHWLSSTFTGLGGVIVGMSARDHGVTSEAAGAK